MWETPDNPVSTGVLLTGNTLKVVRLKACFAVNSKQRKVFLVQGSVQIDEAILQKDMPLSSGTAQHYQIPSYSPR